jgi:C4-dicarboxylate-specific signal transduction histidine kinase
MFSVWIEKSNLELNMPISDGFGSVLRGLLSYAVAVISVWIAVVVTLRLGSAMRHTPTIFFCAVMLSSWFGGLLPGIFAGLLSAVALDYFFIPPLHALGISVEEAPDMIAFVVSALFISWLSGEQKRAKDSLRQARDELDARVQERTAELKQANKQLQSEIAERKGAEEGLVRAQAEIARVARIVTVGEFAASIAHELNQPLAGVVINGSACLRWLAAKPPNINEARQAVERAMRDANRAGNVLVRIRGLLRKGERLKERLDINEVIREVIALAHGELRRMGVSLRTKLAEGVPAVIADRVQLQQVMLNLIMNAIEAMHGVADRERVLRIRSDRQHSSGIVVVVEDSGVGLDPEHSDRVFEAFFTTKPDGIGMGLAISRSIIEAHGGQLTAATSDGAGAIFRFTLPADGGGRV